MQPLPPAGSQPQLPRIPSTPPLAATSPAVPLPQDGFKPGETLPQPPTAPSASPNAPQLELYNPRPALAPTPALAWLAQPLQLQSLQVGPLTVPLWQQLQEPTPDPWQRRPTPSGWCVPKNPQRSPLRAHYPWSVIQDLAQLGPLRVAPSWRGQIRSLRLHWPEARQEPAFSAHKAVFYDILTQFSPQLELHVVTEGLSGQLLEKLLRDWGIVNPQRVHLYPLQLRSSPSLLVEPLTLWARDGAILMRTQQGQAVLMMPGSFRGDGQVDPRLNRLVIQSSGASVAHLGQSLPQIRVARSPFGFEGGDVVASQQLVLLGANSLAQTMAQLHLDRPSALRQLEEFLGLPLLVVEPQPDFHIDLGVTFLDDQVVAVADPAWGVAAARGVPELEIPCRQTQASGIGQRYQQLADQLATRGYRVLRLPSLSGQALLTPYYTYNNVLLECYRDIKRVYLPCYGVPQLDEAARSVYLSEGFQVVDINSARLSTRLWGAIRCASGDLSQL